MSFFNDAQRDGLLTGRYICSECGGLMEFEDEWEDTLVCPACGHSVDLEHYGMENDEEYDALTDGLYPTVTVRQIMWALKMKPIQKERWETVFDRRDI